MSKQQEILSTLEYTRFLVKNTNIYCCNMQFQSYIIITLHNYRLDLYIYQLYLMN